MANMQALPNIGPELERQLAEIGVTSYDQLKEMGSREAWLRILARDPSACINRLRGLEGAIQGVRHTQLDEATKADLKEFYRQYRPANK